MPLRDRYLAWLSCVAVGGITTTTLIPVVISCYKADHYDTRWCSGQAEIIVNGFIQLTLIVGICALNSLVLLTHINTLDLLNSD